MNTLVVYFSASGVTARVAKELSQHLGADLYEIFPVEPYTEADLNWHDPQSRSSLEMKDTSARPDFSCAAKNMEQYQTILIGFPIWWYEAPRIIQSFLEHYDFSGKTIIPFATSGGSGMGNTDAIIQRSAPNARWKLGKQFEANASGEEMVEWVVSLNI